MIEIERKFLVENSSFIEYATAQRLIKQGYLNSVAERTVRIRIQNEQGFITIKGKSNSSGISRFEWEKEILQTEAIALLNLCEDYVIEKTRYIIPHHNHLFEVDVFQGANEGLIIAEIELENENETFEKPHWLGKEVTGDVRYYNSYLSNSPYKNWKI